MTGENIALEDREIASKIKLLILDVDGVLTDGGIITGCTSEGAHVELKRFNSQDGLGLKLIKKLGIEVAIVSGRESSATTFRARELGINECHQIPSGIKLPVVEQLLGERDYSWESVCMVGDDLVDLPVLIKAALPIAVANAIPEIKRVSKWTTRASGGEGAVREICERLIRAKGAWPEVLDYFYQEPS